MLKRIIKTVSKTILSLLLVVGIYLLAVFFIPFIEVHQKHTSQPKTVPIYLYTNGVHTDLVVPIKNPQKDWSKELLFKNTRSKRTDFKYVGIGWGDKGFYLDTPTWADLKFSTAFKAAFWLSESAMHCTFYDDMKAGDDCKQIMLTPQQYSRLISYIDAKFDRDANAMPILIPTKAVYGNNDAFYEAKGKYSFLDTCNTWANNGLKAAGQKAALWTATDVGIFRHYP